MVRRHNRIEEKGESMNENDSMKIRPKELREDTQIKPQIKRQPESAAETAVPTQSSDKVDVALARAINENLDPVMLLEERKKRVEEIKKLVNSGQYKPDSKAVAQAVGEEIVFEILTNSDS